jgi:hypothetical protein
MEEIDEIFGDYLRFVVYWDQDDNGEKWCEKSVDHEIAEYLENDFINSATSTWDFVAWYEGTGDYAKDRHYKCGRRGSVADILDFTSTCEAIRLIQQTNVMDMSDITPEILICKYLEMYARHLSVEDLRDILGI